MFTDYSSGMNTKTFSRLGIFTLILMIISTVPLSVRVEASTESAHLIASNSQSLYAADSSTTSPIGDSTFCTLVNFSSTPNSAPTSVLEGSYLRVSSI